jgi:adenylate cyclase class 2
MSHEVEIKFLVADLATLQAQLQAAGFREQTPRTHEFNVLYDRAGALRRRGEILRIRKYGEEWTLTHKSKGKAGRHKVRAETETRVADGEQLARVFAHMGFKPAFTYEKYRSEWSDGEGHVVLDETPIGDVAEIEGSAPWIDRTAARLGIDPKQYITKSYVELFTDWKRRTGSRAAEMTFKAVAPERL